MTQDNFNANNFDGKRYHNQQPSLRSIAELLKWRRTRIPVAWPKWVAIEQQAQLPVKVSADKIRLTFINHATVLIQTAALNILTDPIWSDRCSPLQWLGPKRIHQPGIALDALPPIDMVLISHNHYDHLDLATINELQQRFRPSFFTGLDNARLIKKAGVDIQVTEMDWWQTHAISECLTLAYVPAHHWSGRGLFDVNRCLWGGFTLLTPLHSIYFAGDTAYGEHFKEIRERLGDMTVALLPIGAYEARWFMRDMHINPEEAVLAHRELRARYSLGIHFGTFADLSDEAYEQPLIDLAAARQKYHLPESEFRTLKPGISWEIG